MDGVSLIRDSMKRQAISPRLVLGNCHLIDGFSKHAPAFTEHSNLPFYYYLAKNLPRNKVLNLGFGLGLPIIFYMLGHKANDVLLQHDPGKEFYSPRLGIANFARLIKRKVSCFVGSLSDERFLNSINSEKWGAVLINTQSGTFDSIMYSMNVCWSNLSDDGYICLDHSGSGNSRNAVENFSKLVNRKSAFIASRYGHSIIFKDI